MFLQIMGKDSVCSQCIVKYTPFKEVRKGSETRLRKAMRVFDIKSFEELKNLKEEDLEDLENKKDKRQCTIKYKEIKKKAQDDDDGFYY